MKLLFQRRSYAYLGALIAIGVAVVLVISVVRPSDNTTATYTVDTGTVEETVSVSGFVEAVKTADLAFPVTGIVSDVFVDEGSLVEAGEVLATIGAHQLVADRNEALAQLRSAEAAYEEVVSGATAETRDIAATSVTNANTNLKQVTEEYNTRVSNAYRTLITDSLEAQSADPDETATAPTVTGTYSCDTEGIYTISVYRSGTQSGYSYKYNGIEQGINTLYTDQPAALGDCGILLQFASTSLYGNSVWTISIPNTDSTSYTTNLHAYELAKEQAATAIATAENTLALAETEANQTNATTRSETITQKQATIDQFRARISKIDAAIADYSITAPFTGVVTDVAISAGETANATPVISLLTQDAFKLTARIPEIDITKIALDQPATAIFDAKTEEHLPGHVTFISPLATEIDGVAYFETTITLDTQPEWMRSGLNADINIIIEEWTDTVRLPKRFINTRAGRHFVEQQTENGPEETEINVHFFGNDGYAAIDDLNPGDVIIAKP